MSETMTRKAVVGDFARPNMSKLASLSELRFSVRQEPDIPKIDETLGHTSRCAEKIFGRRAPPYKTACHSLLSICQSLFAAVSV
ncbi:MAG: hypothetical protein YPKNTGVA_001838 [Candidatus Fervidibacter sp.]|jgi:hypothetical protein